ncbi:MAG: hypothetical protein WCO22_09070 [Betaproteobacteria bacterium]
MIEKLSWAATKAISLLRTLVALDARLDEIQFAQGAIMTQLALNRQGTRLSDFEFKVFSQWGEDGIIQKLIRHIDIPNKAFIEFGVQDFRESNCRFLLMHNNWQGLVIDASSKHIAAIRKSSLAWRHHLDAICEFIDRDNINELLARGNFGDDIGILSIDIDGVDYWILGAITHCKPRILIVEFNSVFGAERPITVPYDPGFVRTEKHHSNLYFGASLAAFHHNVTRRGYSLVGTNSAGSNAFFVRNDQMANCPFPALSVKEAFVTSMVREAKDKEGNLTLLSGDDRLTAIRGLPVVNVVTGETETL